MKTKIKGLFHTIRKTLSKLASYPAASLRRIWDAVVSNARRPLGIVKLFLLVAMLVCLAFLCVMTRDVAALRVSQSESASAPASEPTPAAEEEEIEEKPEKTPRPTASPKPTATPKPRVTAPPPGTTTTPDFSPAGDVANISETTVSVDGRLIGEYEAEEGFVIDFAGGDCYASAVSGITTYLGNNFRSSAQYGLASISEERFGDYWIAQTSSRSTAEGVSLSGTGWTGQPLAVSWPKEMREDMDMFTWAREKDELMELIFVGQDGRVYFLDMETGSRTRETIDLGMNASCGGALDPRGYPLLYVGGSESGFEGNAPCMMIVDLLKGEVVYSFGAEDEFAIHWQAAFCAAPLVDAASDQLIVLGENGLLYLVKLNTEYDAEEGEISVSPDHLVKWKYTSDSADAHSYGYSASPVIWREHLIAADRGGDLFCLDLNTLTVDWCIDSVDCARCTPILEVDGEGHPWLYMAPSFEYGFRAYYQADVPVWKLDAETGEIVWQRDYSCFTEADSAGGVIGGFALGAGNCEGVLYVELARCPTEEQGLLLALDATTGEELWRYESHYSYAAPTFLCDTEQKGYLLHVTRDDGSLCLLDAETGVLLDQYNFGVTMESSPIVVENTVIVGTEHYSLFGIRLS